MLREKGDDLGLRLRLGLRLVGVKSPFPHPDVFLQPSLCVGEPALFVT